ncbi:MAG TPA: PIN domain-containing protein [Chthonomonadaceae bacterium]|nr:PIN domain-containing protein [Chthonomonadaceae bacterium]
MNIVLDASALLAHLRGEIGADVVDSLLSDADTSCYMHVLNLYEIFYLLSRDADEEAALTTIQDYQDVGMIVCDDIDAGFWQDAGRLKAAYPMSPPDSFGIALARRLGAEFVTADHAEMDPLVPTGLCAIRFIR